MKCLQSGMKREVVQEERSRGKGGGGVESSNNTTGNGNAKEGNINSNGIKVEDQPESTCTYR